MLKKVEQINNILIISMQHILLLQKIKLINIYYLLTPEGGHEIKFITIL